MRDKKGRCRANSRFAGMALVLSLILAVSSTVCAAPEAGKAGIILQEGFFDGWKKDPAVETSGNEEPDTGTEVVETVESTEKRELDPIQFTCVGILDPTVKVEVARCFAPTGYTVENVQLSIGMGVATPVQMVIQAASPDRRVTFSYYSMRSFADHVSTYNDMVFKANEGDYDSDYMAMCYGYRTASGYCDMLKDEFLQEGIKTSLVEEVGPTREQQAILDRMSKETEELYRSVMSTVGRDGKLDKVEHTFARKGYALTLKDAFTKAGTKKEDQVEYYLVVTSMVLYTHWFSDFIYGGGGKKVTGPFGIEMVDGFRSTTSNGDWYPIASYVALIPKEDYDRVYPAFEEFINNTRVTDEFFQMRSDFSNRIQLETQRIQNGYSTGYDFDALHRAACEACLTGSHYVTATENLNDFYPGYRFYLAPGAELFRIFGGYAHVYADTERNVYCSNADDFPAGMAELTAVSAIDEPAEPETEPETEPAVSGTEENPTEEETKGFNFRFPFGR